MYDKKLYRKERSKVYKVSKKYNKIKYAKVLVEECQTKRSSDIYGSTEPG